jgi:Spy/CpxP family protein refolding chaperone
MKKISIGLFAGLLILLSPSLSAYAEPCGFPENESRMNAPEHGMHMMPPMMHHGMDMKDGMPGMGPFMSKRLMNLGLNEKQNEAIKEINRKVLKSAIRKRADLEIAGIELRDILDKDSVDLTAVEALLKKIESLNADIHFLHIKAMEEIKALLTLEQKKKMRTPPDREEISGKKQQDK